MSDDAAGAHRAIILDRDGVINRRRGLLVRHWTHFEFAPGAAEAVARLAKTDYKVVVATNQPAVGWSWIQQAALAQVHENMVAAIEDAGGRVDAVYACVHAHWVDCGCRKPMPGMLHDAERDLGLDLSRSWMVGDNKKDLVAGRRAGCRTILVNPSLKARLKGAEALADLSFPHLADAVDYLLDREEARGRGEAAAGGGA